MAVLTLALQVFCFGQAGADTIQVSNDPGKTEKVKVVRTFSSEAGLKKMRPFTLTKELYFDTLSRVQKEVGYMYSESIFGVDSSVVVQEYTYAGGSNTVSFLKKTSLHIVNKERYKNEVGYEFDQHGAVRKTLVYQPDGTMKVMGGDSEDQQQEASSAGQPLKHDAYANYPAPLEDTPGPMPRNARSAWLSPSRPKRTPPVPQPLPDAPVKTLVKREELANGYVIREETTSGKLVAEQRVLLNDQKLVSHIISSVSGAKQPKTISIENFVYNNNGKEIERTIRGEDGKLVTKYSHAYDAQGHLVKSVESDKKGKVKKVMQFEYEFH
ncbi:hypothetical protein [Rufibacter tibetensis]|uniref:hypothetical protein n=1 Tax=Rufibacter tibetensis TaxID=512763 RepID=UPI0012FBAC1C|nr:hypothetical protein [Rufibacter tibetensis]